MARIDFKFKLKCSNSFYYDFSNEIISKWAENAREEMIVTLETKI